MRDGTGSRHTHEMLGSDGAKLEILLIDLSVVCWRIGVCTGNFNGNFNGKPATHLGSQIPEFLENHEVGRFGHKVWCS